MAPALVSSNPSFSCSLIRSRFSSSRKLSPYQIAAVASSSYIRVRAMQHSSNPDPSKETSAKRNSSVGQVRASGSWLPPSNVPAWATLAALGSLLIVAVPFYKRIFRVQGNIREVAEDVIEAVEKVAEVSEKIASEVADALPDGASLKEKALLIEHFFHEVDKDAKIAEAIVHQVDHIKEELDTLVEPAETHEKEQMEEEETKKDGAKESTDDQTKVN